MIWFVAGLAAVAASTILTLALCRASTEGDQQP